jgi:hypothetical protein
VSPAVLLSFRATSEPRRAVAAWKSLSNCGPRSGKPERILAVGGKTQPGHARQYAAHELNGGWIIIDEQYVRLWCCLRVGFFHQLVTQSERGSHF